MYSDHKGAEREAVPGASDGYGVRARRMSFVNRFAKPSEETPLSLIPRSLTFHRLKDSRGSRCLRSSRGPAGGVSRAVRRRGGSKLPGYVQNG
jgi:hypothetical protein